MARARPAEWSIRRSSPATAAGSSPRGFTWIDLVTEHEFGHQYWYGMVATNEFENGWLDEGINSYTEVKVLDNMYGANASVINLLGAQLGDAWPAAHGLPGRG